MRNVFDTVFLCGGVYPGIATPKNAFIPNEKFVR
jgi:hypothetical protein